MLPRVRFTLSTSPAVTLKLTDASCSLATKVKNAFRERAGARRSAQAPVPHRPAHGHGPHHSGFPRREHRALFCATQREKYHTTTARSGSSCTVEPRPTASLLCSGRPSSARLTLAR